MVAYGEENRDWGALFAVYRGLTRPCLSGCLRPDQRGPRSSAAVSVTPWRRPRAVRTDVCDFSAARATRGATDVKWQAMSADIIKMPLVLRVSVGSQVRRAVFAGLDS
jgi:2-oxoisovalerate dehydrogenase E1 component